MESLALSAYVTIGWLVVSNTIILIDTIARPKPVSLFEIIMATENGIDRLAAIMKEADKVKHLNDERRKIWIVDRIKKDIANEVLNK